MAIESSELPELSLRYPGFPRADGEPALRLISVPIGTTAPPASKQVDIAKANPLQALDAELLRYQTSVAIGRSATVRDIEEHRRSLIGTGYVWGVEGDVFSFDTWANHLGASLVGRGNVDPAEDSRDGSFIDKGFTAVLDSELMLDARLVERRAQKGMLPEAKYNITQPTGSTYEHLEKQQRAAALRIERGKRSAVQPPRQFSNKRTGANVMRERSQRWAAVGRSSDASPSQGSGERRHGAGGRSDTRDD